MPDAANSVLTQHNDNSRTGAYLQETLLTTSNVNSNQFGKLFEYHADGHVYAQPLYVSNINMPDGNTHNVVYVATMHNTVYAFDADNPVTASSPLWTKSLGPSARLPDANIGPTHQGQPMVNGVPTYRDIAVEVGIVSTPVISLDHNAMYVVAFTKEGNSYFHRLHALDLTNGAELFKGPVQIGGSFTGTSGTITFTSNRQLQRAALLLDNDTVYIAFASYGDQGPYHGWIFAYNATTLQREAIYNTSPNGSAAGIWQSGQGPAADSNGFIYVMTGNGTYTTDARNVGNSFVKLRPNLTISDWFTPYNTAFLTQRDKDLGSGGPLLIPATNLLIGGGKESKFYLIKTNQMGHFNAANDNQVVQSFYVNEDANFTHRIYGGPVYWNGPNGPCIYVWAENDNLKAYQFDGERFQTTPISRSSAVSPGMPGGMLSVSGDGGTPGTGIVWASRPFQQSAEEMVVQGLLQAYDASDLTRELWNSKQNAGRDDYGNFAKFCAPTIANGKVYMATFSGKVVVYGLLEQ